MAKSFLIKANHNLTDFDAELIHNRAVDQHIVII